MTAVLEIFNEGGNWFLNIKPEVCSDEERGINIPVTQEEKEVIESMDWYQE